MSINLCFYVKGSNTMIDFPYQTPSNLTWAVMGAQTDDEKIKLIEAKLEKKYRDEIMIKVKALIRSPNLELSYI